MPWITDDASKVPNMMFLGAIVFSYSAERYSYTKGIKYSKLVTRMHIGTSALYFERVDIS